jgi:hypothetical protein
VLVLLLSLLSYSSTLLHCSSLLLRLPSYLRAIGAEPEECFSLLAVAVARGAARLQASVNRHEPATCFSLASPSTGRRFSASRDISLLYSTEAPAWTRSASFDHNELPSHARASLASTDACFCSESCPLCSVI